MDPALRQYKNAKSFSEDVSNKLSNQLQEIEAKLSATCTDSFEEKSSNFLKNIIYMQCSTF